jgi:hypothetical protein
MSYIFLSPVSLPFRRTESMLDWAKAHCSSYITNDTTKDDQDWYYRFYFGDERDYLMFKLRWS